MGEPIRSDSSHPSCLLPTLSHCNQAGRCEAKIPPHPSGSSLELSDPHSARPPQPSALASQLLPCLDPGPSSIGNTPSPIALGGLAGQQLPAFGSG